MPLPPGTGFSPWQQVSPSEQGLATPAVQAHPTPSHGGIGVAPLHSSSVVQVPVPPGGVSGPPQQTRPLSHGFSVPVAQSQPSSVQGGTVVAVAVAGAVVAVAG